MVCNFDCRNFALVPIDAVLLEWADEIVCMDKEQEKIILSMIDKPIQCLNIDDNYTYMDERLQQLIVKNYHC